jgi:hypothetical protein
MKSQPPQTSKKASRQRATLKPWNQMNRKQRREMQRKIQSADLSLATAKRSALKISKSWLLMAGSELPMSGAAPEWNQFRQVPRRIS